jgi:hypothetical protein
MTRSGRRTAAASSFARGCQEEQSVGSFVIVAIPRICAKYDHLAVIVYRVSLDKTQPEIYRYQEIQVLHAVPACPDECASAGGTG